MVVQVKYRSTNYRHSIIMCLTQSVVILGLDNTLPMHLLITSKNRTLYTTVRTVRRVTLRVDLVWFKFKHYLFKRCGPVVVQIRYFLATNILVLLDYVEHTFTLAWNMSFSFFGRRHFYRMTQFVCQCMVVNCVPMSGQCLIDVQYVYDILWHIARYVGQINADSRHSRFQVILL